MAATSDFAIIGSVLAVSLAIIALSGIALYVSFRIRETMREERGRGARVVKLTLLIGLLFLAGGTFYFFASQLSPHGTTGTQTDVTTVIVTTVTATGNPIPTTTDSSSTSSSGSSSATGTSTDTSSATTSSSSASSAPTSSTSSASGAAVTLQLSYPTRVKASSTLSLTFTIYDSESSSVSSVYIQLGSLLSTFSLVSSTSPVSGSVVDVGSIPSGTTMVTLTLTSPSRAGQFSSQVSMDYQGMSSPLSATVTIQTTA